MNYASPFSRPFYVMAKPAGAACNLACDYCYYLEKSCLYPSGKSRQVMSDDLLERFTREYIQAQTTPEVLFTWHGGEPLLRPLSFYRRAVQLQGRYAGGRAVDNCLQTNGTLLTDEWCRFFKDNGWLIGISIDGPQEYHDAYRKARGGQPTFNKVMKGIELLDKHGVEWNAMAVANRLTASHPLEFYRFFKSIGCHYLQFTPVVERLCQHADGRHLAAPLDGEERLADFSVTPRQWGDFTCAIFDEWVRSDVGICFVQLFDATLANWMGEAPGVCSLSETCGQAGAMELNGDVYSCDHYVFPEYCLGNIREHTMYEMMHGKRQLRFGLAKRDTLPRQCRMCEYLFACHGECPKNRFACTADGERGLNYLCDGYRRFFHHVTPHMDFMKQELLHNRAPANIVEAIAKNKGLISK